MIDVRTVYNAYIVHNYHGPAIIPVYTLYIILYIYIFFFGGGGGGGYMETMCCYISHGENFSYRAFACK